MTQTRPLGVPARGRRLALLLAATLAISACSSNSAPPAPAGHEGHGGHDAAPSATGAHAEHASSGAVEVAPAAVLALGIRTEPAADAALALPQRAPAAAAWDPLGVTRITAQTGGQVRALDLPRSGETVPRSKVVARLYQPELRAAFAELLVSVGLGEPWASSARSRLLALGASEAEIEAALSAGKAPETYAVHAPVAGLLVERSAAVGDWLAAGGQLAVIASPEAIIVEATVSGPAPAPGTAVTLRDPASSDQWTSTVLSTLPTASAAGAVVRLDPEGPVPIGRPLVAEWQGEAAAGVWVPRSALVDTGERRVVFVATSEGHYAPRAVEVGQRAGERVQVLSGVSAGEPVVVSGSFLLDSETQIGAMGHAGHGG